ncbi:DJ-1/PfpI family protein [Bacillus horti]|uniref:Transcriptional regulator GlxA family with amidase domain n=1 Tax=Caldalkalibacillus horti TaxID=77523 RepID=A0ABT9VY89_9BACI|nr:DJ-1/PfpI family protein [Bacillus horti]MDQ0165585.1 transcriptional regulator GlxA family with amidase domain [Bacillus horti]
MDNMKKQWNVGILLFDHVDVLDYSGPFEVFSLTVREKSQVSELLMNTIKLEDKPFVVKTISETGELVTTHNGLKLLPDYSFQSLGVELDLLIVPGGPLMAIKKGVKNKALLNWIASQQKTGVIVASVCTGALFLAESGILDGYKATTNAFALDYLEEKYRNIEVIRGVRFVDNGNVMTSAGVAAGIDMSLYIVGKLIGEEAAKITSTTIEYPYYKQ